VPLHAVNVNIAIWHFSCALALKNHAPQAFHGGVVRLVQRLFFVTQQFNSLANAAWLVNAALLADGQVHGKVQKRVVPSGVHIEHGGQSGIDIG
jgi:hypothetical protein